MKFRIFENWHPEIEFQTSCWDSCPLPPPVGSRRGAPSSPSARAPPQGCCPKPAAHGNTFTRSPAQVYGLPASATGGAVPPATVRLSPGRAASRSRTRRRRAAGKGSLDAPRRPRPARARPCAYSTTSGAFLQQRVDRQRARTHRHRLRAPEEHTTGIGGVHRGLAPAMGTKIQQGRRRPARRRPHGRRARRPGSGTTSSRGERVLSSRAPRIHRAGPRRSAASTRPAAGHCPPLAGPRRVALEDTQKARRRQGLPRRAPSSARHVRGRVGSQQSPFLGSRCSRTSFAALAWTATRRP